MGKGERGQALIEISLLAPILLFLFLGMVNFGFFVYAFISAGNAARVSAQYTSRFQGAANQDVACQAARREMKSLPNVFPMVDGSACTGDLQVTATRITEPTFNTPAMQVTVTYVTIQVFPLPFMSGKMTINRTAVIPVMPA